MVLLFAVMPSVYVSQSRRIDGSFTTADYSFSGSKAQSAIAGKAPFSPQKGKCR